jgi:hypothetical protein
MSDEFGRILTLEVRHSKRQRNIGEASLKKLPSAKPNTITTITAANNKNIKNSIPPDVISSNKPLKDDTLNVNVNNNNNLKKAKSPIVFNESATRKSNQHILDEHTYKKSQISAPILTIESDISASKKANKTLRGDYFKMDLLNLDTNLIQNQIGREYEPSLIKTIYHVELPPPPAEFIKIKEEMLNNENGKKSKDFKNAWKRFVGIASSKFKNKYDNSEEDDSDEHVQDKSIQSETSEIKQGKVKDIIKKLSVVHANDNNCKHKEYDSGYLSAESLNNDNSLTEVATSTSTSSATSPTNIMLANHNKVSEADKTLKKVRPQIPPPLPPANKPSNAKNGQKKNFSIQLFNNSKNLHNINSHSYLNHEDLVNINIYSSDEDDDDPHDSIHENFDTCEDVGADSDFSFVN